MEDKRKVFCEKAERLKPKLYKKVIKPKECINVQGEKAAFLSDIATLEDTALGKDDTFCVDFKDYAVGHVSFTVTSPEKTTDAPAMLRLRFAERLFELSRDIDSYHGELSKSWIQEEIIHVDEIPCTIKLPRRYAFRYMKVDVIDTSPKFKIQIKNILCECTTSADESVCKAGQFDDNEIQRIDSVGLKTLKCCMQDVFEDGPKRDKRLWIGDLRLQALVNYRTFKNTDLVKRCIYLFAGTTDDEGRVPACLYVNPTPIADEHIALFDYSLTFVLCLYDYYKATKDKEFVREMWDTAYRQIEIACDRLDENDVVLDSDDWWCFLDWNDDLNKQAGAEAVLIYALRCCLYLAQCLNEKQQSEWLSDKLTRVTEAAIRSFWDDEQGFFVSGVNHQISWATQIWFVIAGVFDKAENVKLLDRLISADPPIGIKTPYMYHYLVEALLLNDCKEKAMELIKGFWGEMVKDGADCFFEIYDVNDKELSPYGDNLINSYCHAWSCTPTYLIREYY